MSAPPTSGSPANAYVPNRLLGLDAADLVTLQPWGCKLQPGLVEPVEQLGRAAGEAGFQLEVASGFRSFERQLQIWNTKVQGRRPVLDDAGEPLDPGNLSEAELLFAILRWSALPGTSRHHWGTDLDVYDSSRLPPGYQLQLTVEETIGEGPCAEFHLWLGDYLSSMQNPGFFRPYGRDRGGVAPEPWHLSYAPLAAPLAAQLTPAALAPVLQASDLLLKDAVLEQLEDIFARFVWLPAEAATD